MTKDEVIALLQGNGFAITSEGRLPNGSGWQIKCSGGETINVYDSGKVVPQGKNLDRTKAILGQMPSVISASNPANSAPASQRKDCSIFRFLSGLTRRSSNLP